MIFTISDENTYLWFHQFIMWLFLIINRLWAVRMILFFTHSPNKNFAQSYLYPQEAWKIQVSWQRKHDNWWLQDGCLLWRFLITTFHSRNTWSSSELFSGTLSHLFLNWPKEEVNIIIITFKNKPLRMREVKWFVRVTQLVMDGVSARTQDTNTSSDISYHAYLP